MDHNRSVVPSQGIATERAEYIGPHCGGLGRSGRFIIHAFRAGQAPWTDTICGYPPHDHEMFRQETRGEILEK